MKELIIKVDEEKMDIEGNAPVVDRPQELVRCKDCKHLIDHPLFMDDGYCRKMREDYCIKFKPNADWFCADGERRET